MNFKKEKNNIDSLLLNINNCKNLDDFYRYTSKLYYSINTIVFNIEKDYRISKKDIPIL